MDEQGPLTLLSLVAASLQRAWPSPSFFAKVASKVIETSHAFSFSKTIIKRDEHLPF
jgi:hypothetical protein